VGRHGRSFLCAWIAAMELTSYTNAGSGRDFDRRGLYVSSSAKLPVTIWISAVPERKALQVRNLWVDGGLANLSPQLSSPHKSNSAPTAAPAVTVTLEQSMGNHYNEGPLWLIRRRPSVFRFTHANQLRLVDSCQSLGVRSSHYSVTGHATALVTLRYTCLIF
jgi:hypothetical protein